MELASPPVHELIDAVLQDITGSYGQFRRTSSAMAPPWPRSGRVACALSPIPVMHPSNQGLPACTRLHAHATSTASCMTCQCYVHPTRAPEEWCML